MDADIPTSETMINDHEVECQERSREDYVNAIVAKSNASEEAQEISDDDDDDDDDDDGEEEDVIQEEVVSFVESFAILDKMKKCSFLDDESQICCQP